MSIVLDRWSNRSSWLGELAEWYRVQMNFEVLGREFHPDELKTRINEVKMR